MTTWSRKKTFVAGLAIILVVNVVALGGVAYNRSGDPESILHLSQRELQVPYEWGNGAENSGVAVSIMWRVLTDETENLFDSFNPYWSSGGSPAWLDKGKLAVLGFAVDQLSANDDVPYSRQQSKEMFLVLELDGPEYQKALERTTQYAAHVEQVNIANIGNKDAAERIKSAKEQLEREQRDNSRLFVIDAGLDAVPLRAKYPDLAHYAVVRGKVRPQPIFRQKERHIGGYITSLSISEINVPVEFRQGLKLPVRRTWMDHNNSTGSFEAEVAFGKRLEPWIRAMSGKSF